MTSAKQFLFDFITNRDVKNVLIMFIEAKNVNNYLIFSFSYNLNESDMIFFINVIFVNVKGEVYELEMRFRIYIIRTSSKPRVSIFKKIINLIISFRSSFELRFFEKIIMRKSNVKYVKKTIFFNSARQFIIHD